MKKILFLLSFFSFLVAKSYATTSISEPSATSTISFKSNSPAKSEITIEKSIEKSSEKSFKEKLIAKVKQKVFTSKLLKKFLPDDKKEFHWDAFALAFFLGLVGLLIIYLIYEDSPDFKSKMRSGIYGFIAAMILGILMYGLVLLFYLA